MTREHALRLARRVEAAYFTGLSFRVALGAVAGIDCDPTPNPAAPTGRRASSPSGTPIYVGERIGVTQESGLPGPRLRQARTGETPDPRHRAEARR